MIVADFYAFVRRIIEDVVVIVLIGLSSSVLPLLVLAAGIIASGHVLAHNGRLACQLLKSKISRLWEEP